MKFNDILIPKDGMIKGPFGSAVKKSLFVPKSENAYKVYEQSVVASKDFSIGNYYLDSQYVDSKLQRFFVEPGDILMTGAGTLGLLAEVPQTAEKGIMNQALIRIRLNEDIIYKPYFLYYFPWAIKDFACRINGDSVIPNLPPLSVLKNIDIEIPDILHQKKIADVLDNISKKIYNNNKIISELESMVKTIYDYWFLQFEFPNEEEKPYKSSGGKMVWNEELKREIPEGWKVKNIFNVADIIYGFPLSVEKFNKNGNIPVIRIRDITSNSISAYTNELFDEKYLTKEGDLLIGMDGNFQMNFWFRDGDCVNQRITRIREIDYPNYLIMLQIKPFIEKKVDSVARSTVGHLSDKDMKSLKILIPNNFGIYTPFRSILNKQLLVTKENQELTSLRDFILPLLMNGQVGFREVTK